MQKFENFYKQKGYKLIAGVDEAGRGPLAGPVVAAACIFKGDVFIDGIDDSKKLSEKKRSDLFFKIMECDDIIKAVSIVDAKIIDEINVLQATFLAMRNAVNKLAVKPDFVLIDGNLSPKIDIAHECIVKGDSKSLSIAAASILAKYTRDELMLQYHKKYPDYSFDKHKGYGTKKHIDVIKEIGICKIHRKTFEPIKSLLKK